jgi:lipopolysaccharide export system protein LptA
MNSRPLLSPRQKPKIVNDAVTFLVAMGCVGGALGSARAAGEDALKRPIAEAGLAESINAPAVPRAIAVGPREAAAEPAPKPRGTTEITAMEATFDNKKHEAIFSRNVKVTDPEFSVTCDRLTAMLKEVGSSADSKAPTERSPAAAPKPAGKEKGGLKRAIAEGNVVIRQSKVEADGSTSQSEGRAQKADYNAVTGDIVLTGSPAVKQGFNECIATSPETVMTLNRDRNMRVIGPHRTIISDKAELEK